MNLTDLIPGATYRIKSVDEYHHPWEGTAIYIGPTDDTYPPGCGEFRCDDHGLGIFKGGEIIELVPTTISERANGIVNAILADLSGRGGFDEVLGNLSEPIRIEMHADLVRTVITELTHE